MAQDSTDIEQLADRLSQLASEASLTEPFRAELSLSFGTAVEPKSYRLSIEAPTYRAVRSILQGASASLFATASQDQSSGD